MIGNGSRAKYLVRPLLIFVVAMWLIEIFDRLLFGGSLDHFGIVPRQLTGCAACCLPRFSMRGFRAPVRQQYPFLVLGFHVMLRHSLRF